MKLGEIISDARKVKGLSQEALGELVGVSRQAVSKWEAGRAAPDVENCVALCRTLDLSLGQLLELEGPQGQTQLTPEQLAMVEQVADRLILARKPRRLGLVAVLAAIVAVICLVAGGRWVGEKWWMMEQSVESLSREVSAVRSTILTRQDREREEVLRAQSGLVTDFTVRMADVDIQAKELTVEMTAILKSAGEGTKVSFLARGGGEDWVGRGSLEAGNTARGQVTIPLIDEELRLYLVTEEAGQVQTQLLATREKLAHAYSLQLDTWADPQTLDGVKLQDGRLPTGKLVGVSLSTSLRIEGVAPPLSFEAIGIGVFCNDALARYEDIGLEKVAKNEEDATLWYSGAKYFRMDEISFAPGDTFTLVALLRDSLGREASRVTERYRVGPDGTLHSDLDALGDMEGYGLEQWN